MYLRKLCRNLLSSLTALGLDLHVEFSAGRKQTPRGDLRQEMTLRGLALVFATCARAFGPQRIEMEVVEPAKKIAASTYEDSLAGKMALTYRWICCGMSCPLSLSPEQPAAAVIFSVIAAVALCLVFRWLLLDVVRPHTREVFNRHLEARHTGSL